MIEIYFYGSLPQPGKIAYGGGEIGNQRTIGLLGKCGYRVRPIRKFGKAPSDARWVKILQYPFKAGFGLLKFFFILLFGSRNSVVHLSGFYGVTIAYECALLYIAKLLNYRVVYELRGGGADEFYRQGTDRYRKQFDWIIKNADYLFSQGRENEPLLRSIAATPVFYYPNYVEESFYHSRRPQKPVDRINLLFFGRLEPQKNILMIVEIARLLQQQFEMVFLTIIGTGNADYVRRIKADTIAKLKAGSYEFIQGCDHQELKRFLVDKHYYLFPSEQKREGHSNALTEAMSYGLVPVASAQGFNRTVIGNDLFVVDEFDAQKYADVIASITHKNEFEKYSDFVYWRVIDNYTEYKVRKNLEAKYNAILRKTNK